VNLPVTQRATERRGDWASNAAMEQIIEDQEKECGEIEKNLVWTKAVRIACISV
jgi:hypothetical protein